MGRKGTREKPRVDYDLSPKNWLETIPLVFLSRGESRHSGENLRRMDEYLCGYNVKTEWLDHENCDEEMALFALIDSQHFKMIEHEAMEDRSNVRHREWAPVKGGESLRQNIPQRTFQDLIRNDNPSELYRIYIVSENDTIFYIGKAGNPISRLCKRLNPYDGETSEKQFTCFLRRYIDDALSTWKIQLLTLQDCESLVVETILARGCEAETIKSEVIEKYTTDETWAKKQAERVLIWRFRPCLNKDFNPFPKQLPAKYSDFTVSYSHVLQLP
jgi:hypothetical protein